MCERLLETWNVVPGPWITSDSFAEAIHKSRQSERFQRAEETKRTVRSLKVAQITVAESETTIHFDSDLRLRIFATREKVDWELSTGLASGQPELICEPSEVELNFVDVRERYYWSRKTLLHPLLGASIIYFAASLEAVWLAPRGGVPMMFALMMRTPSDSPLLYWDEDPE